MLGEVDEKGRRWPNAESQRASGGSFWFALAVGLIASMAMQALAHWGVVAGYGALTSWTALALPAVMALGGTLRRGLGARVAVLSGFVGLVTLAAISPQAARLIPLACNLTICGGLAWLFGRTLVPGRDALVTQMARKVHGTLPVPIVAYTRNVTRAWTLFLCTLGTASILLFVLTPLPVWSMFANLLFLPLVGLMFLAEYGYRMARYRSFSHETLAQTIAAFHRR